MLEDVLRGKRRRACSIEWEVIRIMQSKQRYSARKTDGGRKSGKRNAIWPEGTSLQAPLEITSISPSLASSSRKINAISSFSESLGGKSLRVKREQRYNAWASACAPTQRRRQIIAAAAAPTTTIGQEAEKNRAILKEAQKFVETTDKANWSLSSPHPPLDQFVGIQSGMILNTRGKKLQQLKYWKRMSPSQIKIYPNDPHVTHLCWLRDHEDWRELVGGQLKARYGLTREGFTLVLTIWDESTHIFLPMVWGFQICKNLLPLRMSIPVPRVSNFFYLTPLTPFGRKEGKVRHVIVAQWYRVGHRGTMPFYYLSLFTFFICRNYFFFCKINLFENFYLLQNFC